MLRQELFGPLPEQFKSQFGFPLRPKQFEFQFVFPLRPKQFEPQLGAPDMGAKQEDRGGAEGFTHKSTPLGHRSGIFRREKKGNTYATSTHFYCFFTEPV